MSASLVILKPAISKIVSKISPHILSFARAKYIEYSFDKIVNLLEQRSEQIFKVRTIYENRKPLFLSEFYYPTKLIINDDEPPVLINCLSDLKIANNIVIEGTVGHGKSMFMRHLSLNEILNESTLPIFFELRKLNKNEKLLDALCSYLSDLFDLDIEEKDFFLLARNGSLSLFLDGFDEVSDSETVNNIIRYLESWSVRFPHMRVVCSARPDTAIQKNPHFYTLKISDYDENDQKKFIYNLTKDNEVTTLLMDKICNGSMDIQDLLTTPLMLTFFLKTYEVKLKTPLTLSDFYADLFDVLMNRHDALKAPFNRERFIEIEDRVLQNIFEEFCLYSKQEGNKLSFDKKFFTDGLEDSLQTLGLSVDPKNLINEYTKNICLILQDGVQYSFIHKSIQEFFIANLIKSFDTDSVKEFYEKMQSMRYSKDYLIELQFLKEMDKLNYIKFYLIPSINYFMEKIEDEKYLIDRMHIITDKQSKYKLLFEIGEDFFKNHAYINRNYISNIIIDLFLSKDLELGFINIVCADTISGVVIEPRKTQALRNYLTENSIIHTFFEKMKQELIEAEAFLAIKQRKPLKIRKLKAPETE